MHKTNQSSRSSEQEPRTNAQSQLLVGNLQDIIKKEALAEPQHKQIAAATAATYLLNRAMTYVISNKSTDQDDLSKAVGDQLSGRIGNQLLVASTIMQIKSFLDTVSGVLNRMFGRNLTIQITIIDGKSVLYKD